MTAARITDLAAAGTLLGTEFVEISALSTTVTITAATISAAASDNSYNDSGNGFVTAGFDIGDRVKVSGFTGSAANNILVGTITALTAGKMTIGGAEGEVIVDDAAGESVTITKWVSQRVSLDEILQRAAFNLFKADISPAQITATQNDYNPTGLSTASLVRVNSDAARSITGLAGGADGRSIVIANVGAFSITLEDEDAGSTAGNRFALAGDLVMAADTAYHLEYDATSSRWRLVGAVSLSGTGLLASNNLSDVANAVTAGANIRPVEHLAVACSDETTAITTGTGKVTFRMPYAFTVTAVRASVGTAPTGSTIIIDINEAGASILSTKLSIDASEKTSTTAASAAVISDGSLADDAEITIDFDQVGSTVAGAGVKVVLIGYRT